MVEEQEMIASDYSHITNDALRAACAEAMEWTDITASAWIGKPPDTGKRDIRCMIPNYPASLDACAEFEGQMTDLKFETYAKFLGFPNHGKPRDFICATARQRCLAYLSVVAPWQT